MTDFSFLTISKIISYQTSDDCKECRSLNRTWHQVIDQKIKYLHFYNRTGQQETGVRRGEQYILPTNDFNPQSLQLEKGRSDSTHTNFRVEYYHRPIIIQTKTMTAPFGINRGFDNLDNRKPIFISLTFDGDDCQSRKFKDRLDQIDRSIREKAQEMGLPSFRSSFKKTYPDRSRFLPDLYTFKITPKTQIFRGFDHPQHIPREEVDLTAIPNRSRCKVISNLSLLDISGRLIASLKIIQLVFESPQRNDLFGDTFHDF